MRTKRIFTYILYVLFFVELVRTAWISDDALITARTVLNFLHGYGPTFNIDERVQAYTHPLWFLLVSILTFTIRNVYFAFFILSFLFSLLLLRTLVGVKAGSEDWQSLLPLGLLLLSKAFIDFSTSGLEGPLTFLLLASGVIRGLDAIETHGKRAGLHSLLILGFVYLSHPDAILIATPFAIWLVFRLFDSIRERSVALLALSLPAMLWTSFSLLYYGFPFPNTAYAKLNTGILQQALYRQGFFYFLDSIAKDPITLTTILAAAWIGFQSTAGRMLSSGILLYLFYVIYIGGDFMSGRFFAAPFVLATLILLHFIGDRKKRLVATGGLAVLGLVSLNTTLLSPSRLKEAPISPDGIADERTIYFHSSSILTIDSRRFQQPRWAKGGPNKIMSLGCGGLGGTGISLGPTTHLLDSCALADPLLSHLPILKGMGWRIGHFRRQFPTGYRESLEQNRNLIEDDATREFYDTIRLITRGNLWDLKRITAILRLNLALDQKADFQIYRNTAIPQIPGEKAILPGDIVQQTSYRGAIPASGGVEFTDAIEIVLPGDLPVHEMDFVIAGAGPYRIELMSADQQFFEVGELRATHRKGVLPDAYRITIQGNAPYANVIRILSPAISKHYIRLFQLRSD